MQDRPGTDRMSINVRKRAQRYSKRLQSQQGHKRERLKRCKSAQIVALFLILSRPNPNFADFEPIFALSCVSGI